MNNEPSYILIGCLQAVLADAVTIGPPQGAATRIQFRHVGC